MARSPLLQPPAPVEGSPGTAFLAKGFRPFFLVAGVFAVTAVPLWLLTLSGNVVAPPYLPFMTIHAHEMLHGYAVAVLAGFLLTAVGNWTQRETATGLPLLALALLWVAGRVAILVSSAIPGVITAAVDLSFLPALMVVLARPLLAARNRRNFVMLGILGALWLANATVHLEALGVFLYGPGRTATFAALDLIVLVIAIMAGRVFPMFTRNATNVSTIRSLPMLDRASLGVLLLASALALFAPEGPTAGVAFLVAGLLAVARSVPWGARHSFRDPLLWCLHVGYGWLCLGLFLRGLSLLGAQALASSIPPALSSSATHALTVGAIGGLTLGMMARVALGHTGRMLAAPRAMLFAFLALNLSAAVRSFGRFFVRDYMSVLVLSGALWSLAFAIFTATYAPILLRPRVDGRPG